jgi:hypothetical protein
LRQAFEDQTQAALLELWMENDRLTRAVIRFAAFELDLRAGELRKQGVKIKLQEQPFQILSMLLATPGQVVTREELRNRLWPSDTFVDFDHSLNKAINKLREALGDSAENPRFVETLSGRQVWVGSPDRGLLNGYPADSNLVPESLAKRHRGAMCRELSARTAGSCHRSQ